MIDIKVRTQSEPNLSFILEFHFSPNEYFSNSILEKEYFMKCAPEENDPFSFDGPEIFQSKGTAIQWKDGKDVTAEKREVDGVMQDVKVQSFFNFFSPPELLEDTNHPLFEEVNVSLNPCHI